MAEPPRKKLRSMRRGTKSCLECRRRKIKCTFTDPDGCVPCDGCRTRQTICESQEEAHSLGQIREPTRERVDRLEVIVQNLSNTVAELQRSSREPESQITPESLLNSGGGEEMCLGTDCDSETHRPRRQDVDYMCYGNTGPRERSLRDRIFDMVPSRDDVLAVTASAVDWWPVHNALFPEPAIKNRLELVTIHQKLGEQDMPVTSVALWLAYFGMTILQLPSTFDCTTLESIADPETVVSRISDETETLLGYDAEIGTLEGLKCAGMYAQLQKFMGRPKKGWVMLRRAIAFAELRNLHSAKKSLKMVRKMPQTASTDALPSLQEKANLWSSLCATDRLLSLLLGLPTAASNYSDASSEWDPTDPHASTRRIVSIQSDIANQIFRRDQLEDVVEAQEETIDITKKLQALQKIWPAEWSNIDHWTQFDAKLASCVLFQTGHSFLVLRTLLPFLLKVKDHPVYQPQAMDCLQACRDILKRYYTVRTRFNAGGFMSRTFDVHAFTASVILLIHHDGRVLHMSATDEALLENCKEAMRQAPDRAGLQMTRKMAESLDSIRQCLDGDSASPDRVNLKVPLLGDVTIRRLGDGVTDGELTQGPAPKAKVSFNFDAIDEEWFLHDGDSCS